MVERTRSGVTYSEHRPIFSDLSGLFQNPGASEVMSLTREEELLTQVTKGSKYKPENIVAVGFAIVNGEVNPSIDELYLTSKGFEESSGPQLKHHYQKLCKRAQLVLLLGDELDSFRISPMFSKRDTSPHYKELDDHRVLALYVIRENKKK